MLILLVIASTVLAVNAFPRVRSAITPDYREGLVTAQRPVSLNPLVGAADPAVRDIGELLYRRLLRLDGSALPVADLATGYTVSGDGLTYRLPLRPGQLWSDGRPITLADVIATVTFLQSPRFGDPVTAAPWQDVHARADGDGVTFDLAAPRAAFAAELTRLPILPIGSLSSVDLAHLPATSTAPMATSGPFRVATTTALRLVLIPNSHSPRPPRLNEVDLSLYGSFGEASAAFARGEIDGLLATDPRQRSDLTGHGGVAHDLTSLRFVDLLFNQRGPQLADPVVRQAIATAVDRPTLIKAALAGMAVPQTGPISHGFTWAQSPPTAAQPAAGPGPAAAVAALTAAGWVRGDDGVFAKGPVQLSLSLAVADVPPLPGLAAEIGRQLHGVGIAVTTRLIPAPAMRATLSTSPIVFDMALADWDTGPDPDISAFWRSTAVPPAGFNVAGGPVDPFLDQALDRLATLTDPVARRTAAAAVSSQLADDLPAVFIETPEISLVVRSGLSVQVPPVGDSGARFAEISAWRRA